MFADEDDVDLPSSEDENEGVGIRPPAGVEVINGGSDSGMDDGSEMEFEEDGDEDRGGMSMSPEEKRKADRKKRKKKKKTKAAAKKMTKEEREELEEGQYAVQENLYKVQMKELLAEISVTKELQGRVDEWIDSFKEFVGGLSASKKFSVSENEQILKPIPLPLPQELHPKDEGKGDCKWEPPKEVRVIGSWANGTAVQRISEVDVVLIMPDTFLKRSDFLNHRYHVKRAIYLAYVAKQIDTRYQEIKFGLQGGNPLKPILVICEKDFTVNISAVPVKEFFKLSRFTRENNNLRFDHFFGKPLEEDDPEFATPNYNFTILSDLLTESTEELGKMCSSKGIRDAIKLIKVWLEQRLLRKGYGSFSGTLVTALMAYIKSVGKISSSSNTYDILRTYLANLAKLDLTKKAISTSQEANPSEDWYLQFDVVILDSSEVLNYSSEVSKFTFRRLQTEAERALRILDEGKVAGFHSLFTTPVPFVRNFDHIVQISDVFHLQSKLQENKENEQLFLNHSGFFYPVGIPIIGSLIEKCLERRTTSIDCELPLSQVWPVSECAPNFSKIPLRFGMILNGESAQKSVERCDSEDPVNSIPFKEFWGEKSQLRRFKDGTMCETVVFEDKKRICFQMLQYILKSHLDVTLNSNGTDYLDSQVELTLEKKYEMIRKVEKPKKAIYIKGKRKRLSSNDFQELIPVSIDDITNKATASFDELSKTLRSLKGLPLEITTVQGTSPILRFTDVFPTPPQKFFCSSLLTDTHKNESSLKFKKLESEDLPPKVPKVVEPISIVLHLETSGKWPDDVKAIDRLKCAFLIRIGQLLKDQFGLVVQPFSRHLDVCKDGFVFRITLTYFREITLLKQQLGADGMLRVRDNKESLRLEKESLLLPQLTSTLHSFHRQYPAFGITCRIAKQWLASHLLLSSPLRYNRNPDHEDCRFTEESVELLVAHLFLDYAPYLSPPNEPQTGFLRFISLISKSEWRSTPVILNFHDKMTPAEVSAVELDFVKRRNQLPTIFICTPEDKVSSIWTKHVAPVSVNRAKLIATKTLNVIEETLINESKKYDGKQASLEEDIRGIFRHDESRYNVLIRLKKEMNPHRTEQLDSQTALKFTEYSKTPKELMPIVDFDPVQIYLQELRDAFGHLALFLHNSYGGSYIAVVWRPEVYEEQNFSISNINGSTLSDSSKLSCNIDGALESFEILGKGLVDKIEVKTGSKPLIKQE